jgi:periodic tryptophan protein 1
LSDEELDDYTIHNTDSILVCGTAQDDFSNLEIYIYDERSQSLFVHHDIMLGNYPLCIEWLPLDLKSNTKGNYAIVGSFSPEIEIWNLDMIDAIEPDAVLGGSNTKSSSQLKKKKKKTENPNSHEEAVVSMNLNPFNKFILSSGGSDKKVILWDLNTQKSTRIIKDHKDKIQSVRFNKCEENVLLTAGFDKSLKIYDLRSESNSINLNVKEEIESAEWSPLSIYHFLSMD